MSTLLGLKTDSDELRNLDFLRFIASLAIVYHHSHEFFVPQATRTQWIDQTDGLALFVDLFFIISGFVMGYVYNGALETSRDYLRFLWKRVARLYPLHMFVIALNVVLWAIIGLRAAADQLPSFRPDCIASQALLLQAYYDCGGRTFNGPTWSISVEMGLYAALPLTMFLAVRLPALLALIAAAAFSLVYFLTPVPGEYHLGPPILRGIAGFSAGYLLFRFRAQLPAVPSLVPPLLTFLIIAAMMVGASQAAIVLALFVLAGAAASADRDGRVSSFVDRLSPLGQLTYSMYIWHRLFILMFLNIIADKMFPGNTWVLMSMTVLTLAGIFTASYVGYFLIEVPARRALSGVGRIRSGHAP